MSINLRCFIQHIEAGQEQLCHETIRKFMNVVKSYRKVLTQESIVQFLKKIQRIESALLQRFAELLDECTNGAPFSLKTELTNKKKILTFGGEFKTVNCLFCPQVETDLD